MPPLAEPIAPSGACLVTGATGAIGPALVRTLAALGWPVRVLARTPPPAGLLPPGVEIALGDVTDPTVVRPAMAGIERVFHLAAKLHVPNPAPSLHPEYRRVNVDGTRTVVEAAAAAGVQRLVCFSTISVYGPSRGRTLSEASPPAPETLYAETKFAAERIALAPGAPPATVLRLAAVYGPRIKGNYRRLLEALARRRFVPIGSGANRRTLVHEEDVARAAALASGHPDAAGAVFNVTDGQHPPLDTIVRAMCAALGRRPPRLALPEVPVRVAATMAERAAAIVGRRLPLRAAVDKYLEDVAVDGGAIQRRLGFAPALALEAGWRQTVDALRAAGEL